MARQHIAFRTDATRQIGTGHFMRCLTLADALKGAGARVRFISRNLPAHLSDMLAAKGIELVLLGSEVSESPSADLAHSHWLGTSQQQDAQATIRALSGHFWDWLVVDHYALDARWESALRVATRRLMVIDDLADRQHDCDVLLDQNYYADMQTRYIGKIPAHCQLLLGPRYVLLRDEFLKLRERVKPRRGVVKKILVFFGGVDADNYTILAINALSELSIKGIQVDVVIGAQHPSRQEIENICADLGYFCHVQTKRMAELMMEADLAIGAGGTATWERCCLGLPALSICVAENQRRQVLDAAEAGLLYAPSTEGGVADALKRHIQTLLENPPLRYLISKVAMNEVDGKGVYRTISALRASGIEIRRANEEDSRNLFEWRNHPSIRSVSRNASPITWDDHTAWFGAVLKDNNRVLLIGYIENEPVGVVRFDKDEDIAEVSIYLVPEKTFVRQGRNLLLAAEHWLKEHRPDIKRIRAGVLGENLASQKLFISAQYRLETIHYLKQI